MKDTFYFSHDYNSRNDSKIKKLISKHGFLGYGIFWAVVEDLYNNANALPTDYESIAFDLRTTPPIVESIINDFNLFVIEGEIFGSHSIEKRLDYRNEKSKKAQKSAFARWNKIKVDANALRTQSECNAIKESIVKEIKGKENKLIILPEVKKLRADLKNVFLEIYKLKFNTEYYWEAKDSTAMPKLISKIEFKIKEKGGYATDEKIIEGYKLILEQIKDNWVLANFSIPLINSKFNEIFTQLKTGKNGKSKNSANTDILTSSYIGGKSITDLRSV